MSSSVSSHTAVRAFVGTSNRSPTRTWYRSLTSQRQDEGKRKERGGNLGESSNLGFDSIAGKGSGRREVDWLQWRRALCISALRHTSHHDDDDDDDKNDDDDDDNGDGDDDNDDDDDAKSVLNMT